MGAKRSLVSLDLTSLEDSLELGPLASQVANFGHKLDEKQKALPSLEVPFLLRETDFKTMVSTAEELKANSDIVIVVATGGVYLAIKAVLDAFQPVLGWSKPRVVLIGDHLSADHLQELSETVGEARLSSVMCCYREPSLELAVTQRFVADLVQKRHGKAEGQRRLVLVTGDQCHSWLELAKLEGYRHFKLSDRSRGQFLSLSAATLLPLAVAGVDPTPVLEGGRSLARSMDKQPFEENPCFQFAAVREILSADGRVECLSLPDPRLHSLGQWWRYMMAPSAQVLAPPASHPVVWTTHERSYLCAPPPEGTDPHLFEVSLELAQMADQVRVGGLDANYDGLAPWKGSPVQDLEQIHKERLFGRRRQDQLPLIALEIPQLDRFSFGSLLCFFETVAAVNQRLAEISGRDDTKLAVTSDDVSNLAGAS